MNYVGAYMYMGSDEDRDFFKHSTTRKYDNRNYTSDVVVNDELIAKHNRLLQVAIDSGSDSIALEQDINAIRIDLGLEEITLYNDLPALLVVA